jgi:anti-sigma B factor antagonist
MNKGRLITAVRELNPQIGVIDIQGEVTALAETELADAFTRATAHGRPVVFLNFTQLEYMNSSGIGLLVTLLIRASRQNCRLMAYGFSEHYRQIFELTRLNQTIVICANEASALQAARNLLAEQVASVRKG